MKRIMAESLNFAARSAGLRNESAVVAFV